MRFSISTCFLQKLIMLPTKYSCIGAKVPLLHLILFLLGVIITVLYIMYMTTTQIGVTKTFAHFELNSTNTTTELVQNEREAATIEYPAAAATAGSLYEPGHLSFPSNICPDLGRNVSLLVSITSAPAHQADRMTIRQTWGHFGARKDISIIFMLGTTADQTLTEQLKQEEYLYGDIVIGNFVDTYMNLTLKTLSMLEWIDNYCSSADFVLKTDDDMFINVPRLLEFISNCKPDGRNIYGRLGHNWKPIRDKASKYYISPEEYGPKVLPDFTTGPAYLFPARLAGELYEAALNHTFLMLEDVFLTGVVANDLGINRVHSKEFANVRVTLTACSVQKIISIHHTTSAEKYNLWKILLEKVTEC